MSARRDPRLCYLCDRVVPGWLFGLVLFASLAAGGLVIHVIWTSIEVLVGYWLPEWMGDWALGFIMLACTFTPALAYVLFPLVRAGAGLGCRILDALWPRGRHS